jgi:hypothetical protein
VKHSNSDATMTQSSTVGSARIADPSSPPISTRGMNAASVVSADANTGTSIRWAPPTAVSRGDAPASNSVTASSPTPIGIIDDDADGHHKTEERNDADAKTERGVEYCQAKQKTDRNSGRHPQPPRGR